MKKVPENWQMKTIGEMIKFSGGSQPPRSNFVSTSQEGFVRLIQIRDYKTDKFATYIPKEMASKFCNKEDIMIGRYGPPIFQILRGIEGAYNVALIKAIPQDGLLKQYAFHFLRSPSLYKFIDSLSQRSSGQTGIEMDELKDYPLPLPPVKEQKAIANVFDLWDYSIDQIETLIVAKQERRTWLMQQLLTGKRRLPGLENSRELRETPFGSLPSDWAYPRIGEVAKEVSERNGEDSGRPVLSCTKHKGLVDSLSYFGKQIFSEDLSNYKVVRKSQFAYATNHIDEGSIGYQNAYDEALISPIYTVFQTDETIDDRFLLLVLKTETYRHIFASNTSASVDRRGSLRWNDFAKIHIPRPSIEEQQAIVRVIDTADRELDLLRANLDALREQKKGLMQQLLTGKIRVKC